MNNYGEIVTGADLSSNQFQKISTNQIKNHDGAYVYALDYWKRLDRFLILGVEENTYYQTQRELVKENCVSLNHCLVNDFKRTIDRIVEISTSGRAPKNDSAIFALAYACTFFSGKELSSLHTEDLEEIKAHKQYAYKALPKVCRYGTHLFQFLANYKAITGKKGLSLSSGLKKAIINYYTTKGVGGSAYDCLKYKNRENIRHYDVFKQLRWNDKNFEPLIDYVLKGEANFKVIPDIIKADLAIKSFNDDPATLVEIIKEYGVPWEMIPTEHLNEVGVLRALIPYMGLTALLRNMSRLTKTGAIEDSPSCKHLAKVIEKLTNEDEIKKSKLHPINVAVSTLAYEKGRSDRNSSTWSPIRALSVALETTYLKSFANAESLNIAIDVAFDVSPSMDSASGFSGLTARDMGAIMLSYLFKKEHFAKAYAFNSSYSQLPFASLNGFREIKAELKKLENNFSGTDCSLPVRTALAGRRKVDLFIVFTDNETNARYSGHVSQYLQQYRREINPEAKMLVIGATATECSIADPNASYMLDVAGFDSAIPQIIKEFVHG